MLRAIYVNNIPVGFIKLYISDEENRYYIWRLMIDEHHQNKGYGKAAVKFALNYFLQHTNAAHVLACTVPGEYSSYTFYIELGFVDTGEMDGIENVLKYTINR